MRVILVLSNKLLPSGAMTDRYRRRMQRAICIMSEGEGDLLVISGGATRPEFPPEAEAGFELVPDKLKARTLLETRSKTSLQNIVFVKKLLADGVIDSLTVVTSTSHMPRIRDLVKKFWPEAYPRTIFEPAGRSGIKERILEWVRRIFVIIDPSDRVLMPLLRRFL